jgi:hypothetical protein
MPALPIHAATPALPTHAATPVTSMRVAMRLLVPPEVEEVFRRRYPYDRDAVPPLTSVPYG